ncbi:MAG: hypothetical protein K8S97_10695 [Anaerolineae bacterium]|nr:hypothetical protein [Anaerolineae bacterium]
MRRWKQHTGIVSLIAVLLLADCTFSERSTGSAPESTATPVTLHDTLTARLAEVQHAQALALSLWDRLISGVQVSCQEAIPQPEPVTLNTNELSTHPNAAPVQDALNAASQAVRNSADLWDIECSEARDIVPLSIARNGRATALLATEPLTNAAALLAAWN